MRILLAVPPELEKLDTHRIGITAPPLGLAWIAATLEEEGHKVKVMDPATKRISQNRFLLEAKQWRPDIIGLSALTPTIYKAYSISSKLKEELPDVPIVVGGPHVTYMYREALSTGNIDFVVRGEGEETFRELVEKFEKDGKLEDVKGLAFTRNGVVVVTKPREPVNLDQLPTPARHLLSAEYSFLGRKMRVFHVMASRGCPYGCIYCCSSYFWGRRVRLRSPEKVVDEIEEGVRGRTRNVVFTDDELTIVKPWLIKLTNLIRERGLDIIYACGSRVDHVDREVLRALRLSGCKTVYYGVESADQRTIDKIGKKTKVHQAKKAFSLTKEEGIDPVGSFILGFPWETLDDMMRTISFAIHLKPVYAQFTLATPYPGTPLRSLAQKYGLLVDNNWEHYTTLRAVMKGFNFSIREAQKMLTTAYKMFYSRINFIFDQIRRKRFGLVARVVPKILPWFLGRYNSSDPG
ncbi:MAG: B12-binding domain-containing radical SAM protein [Methanobacteriota archaeon]|nr:MAG: B12-binding domain-containing radical SAM protein [Euryarchaeota archaeon]